MFVKDDVFCIKLIQNRRWEKRVAVLCSAFLGGGRTLPWELIWGQCEPSWCVCRLHGVLQL